MGLFSTKTSFIFHKFTSSCSEGTPKDNDKNKEKTEHFQKIWAAPFDFSSTSFGNSFVL
jgi:hypothetical protein